MRKQLKTMVIILNSLFFLSSCIKDNGPKSNLKLNIDGLEDLGPTARYEGWLIVKGNPISTGVFSVNSSGKLSKTNFSINATALANATVFVLTVEPYPDADPAPSDQHILAGDFNSSSAALTISHPAALNTDFATATGKYILGTPTTSSTADELSGIWFMNLTSGSPAAGLNLPSLPTGWKYEGWVVINNQPVSTGVFTNANAPDQSATFSGPLPAPPFPGEDFYKNAPVGLSFPTNLSGGAAVVSVEPFPDNSPAPFLLKPLLGNIPGAPTSLVTYNLNLNSASFPTGTAKRN